MRGRSGWEAEVVVEEGKGWLEAPRVRVEEEAEGWVDWDLARPRFIAPKEETVVLTEGWVLRSMGGGGGGRGRVRLFSIILDRDVGASPARLFPPLSSNPYWFPSPRLFVPLELAFLVRTVDVDVDPTPSFR